VKHGVLRTTTFRLALAYLALFGGSVVFLFGFIYWATAGTMARQMDETIQAEIVGLADQYRESGIQGLAAALRQRISRDPAGSQVYLLTDPNFVPIVGNLDRWPNAPESTEGWVEFELQDRATPRGGTYVAHARHFTLAGGFHLLIGRDARAIQQVQRLILHAFGWGFAITLALGLMGGLIMGRGTLRRLEAINRISREIMAGDLARRLPSSGAGDDFDQLAQNLNEMLDRIEALMQGIRHVSEGVAHDLRSPLTRLRNRLETARMNVGREPDEQRRLVEASIAEADALLATFNALLRIAEAESGRARAGFTTVDLAVVAQDVIELYEPVAQEKRQTLSTSIEPAPITGDRHLLSQALANLLDNAIKYTPAGGRIQVMLRQTPGGVVLAVTDTGPGVPEAAREKVLERFYRLDESRTTPGSGLGLSLVAAVARLHDAKLMLDDAKPGLKVTLAFPKERAPATPRR
jgi:signal transduction histidine kinase